MKDKLISTYAAGKILGVSTSHVRALFPTPDKQIIAAPGKYENYYLHSKISKLKIARDNGTSYPLKRKADATYRRGTNARLCKQCGLTTTTRKGGLCILCANGKKRYDPYHVMHVPKLQKRKCPVCGGALFEEQYTCSAQCAQTLRGDITPADAAGYYGGIIDL